MVKIHYLSVTNLGNVCLTFVDELLISSFESRISENQNCRHISRNGHLTKNCSLLLFFSY